MKLSGIRYRLRGLGIVRSMETGRQRTVSKIANALSRNFEDVYEFTRSSNDESLTFMRKLSKKYNRDRMEYKTAKPHDKLIIDRLVQTVENPSAMHFNIVREFGGSMEDLARIFDLTQNKKSRVAFVNRMYSDVFENNPNVYENLISDLLESKYSNEIVSHFDTYIPFLKLNRENSFAVKMLENLIENGSYSKDRFLEQIKQKNISKTFPYLKSRIFTPQVYVTRHTAERESILNSLINNSFVNKGEMEEDIANEVMKLFISTNEKNSKLRHQIINAFPVAKTNAEKQSATVLIELNKLFETIEKDKNSRNFVKLNIHNDTGVNSISEFNKMFELLPPKIWDKYNYTATNIIRGTHYQKNYIEAMVREIKTIIAAKDSGKLHGFVNSIGNFSKRIMRKIKPSTEKPMLVEKNETVAQTVANAEPQKQVTEDISRYLPLEYRVSKDAEKPVENVFEQVVENAAGKTSSKVPSLASVRKLKVKEDVMSLVSKKLGAKTLSEQTVDYKKYATRMRFDMLPEIFASIAETRKADRLAGKKKSLSSNFDAVELFKLINGKNKKLVNYLLKKRNENDSRMFEVKEIINIIENAEKDVRMNKKTISGYTSKQTKLYYDNLLEEKIQQFGKVQKQPKFDRKV